MWSAWHPQASWKALCAIILLAAWWSHAVHAASTSSATKRAVPQEPPLCQPQGMLRLDTPYPRPSRPPVDLPFCQQYGECSCCNASHALTIGRQMALLASDATVSASCASLLSSLECRICDPLVGTGVVRKVCARLCDAVLRECGDAFFAIDAHAHRMHACSDATQHAQQALICSQLRDMVTDGSELCSLLGHSVAANSAEPCYDGGGPQHGSNVCQQWIDYEAAKTAADAAAMRETLYGVIGTFAAVLVAFAASAYMFIPKPPSLPAPASDAAAPQLAGSLSSPQLCANSRLPSGEAVAPVSD